MDWEGWRLKYGLIQAGVGSGDHVLGFPMYGKNCDSLLYRVALRPVWRVGKVVTHTRYWLRSRLIPRYRYHVIHTGLEPGYWDEDTRMLHACFTLLGQYVEWHGGADKLESFSAELRDPSIDPHAPMELKTGQADKQDEATALWRWWTIQRSAEHAAHDSECTRLFGGGRLPESERAAYDAFRAEKERLAAKDQEMLHRLIDIRPGLWT